MADNAIESATQSLVAALTTARNNRDEAQKVYHRYMSEVRKIEAALRILSPEHVEKKSSVKRIRTAPSRIGTVTMDEIRSTVITYANDHEEFRQVDIRGVMDISSSKIATAFEQLRQENFIRFARQDGNNKWFRLTRETVNAA